MAKRSIYMYEVVFINKNGRQCYDHCRARDVEEAKRLILTWPDVSRIVGTPSKIG